MSRYEGHVVETREPERYTCQVGWDQGAGSFFAYIARPFITSGGRVVGDNDGHLVRYEGLPGQRILTVDELQRRILSYAVIPELVRSALEEDRRRGSRSALAQ